MVEEVSIRMHKADHEARCHEEKTLVNRRRHLLTLMLRHLNDSGYLDTVEQLQTESGLSLQKFDAADNINLLQVVQEFEDYHQVKFGRKPVLVRRVDRSAGGTGGAKGQATKDEAKRRRDTRNNYEGHVGRGGIDGHHSTALIGTGAEQQDAASSLPLSAADRQKAARERRYKMEADKRENRYQKDMGNMPLRRESTSQDMPAAKSGTKKQGGADGADGAAGVGDGADGAGEDGGLGLGIMGSSAPVTVERQQLPGGGGGAIGGEETGEGEEEDPSEFFEQRMLRPMPASFHGDSETRNLAEVITRDIFMRNPGIRWSDVVELKKVKRLLKEAVVMPIKYPHVFTGLLTPWRGILLHGPPGTGKTMLARAVATECRTTFFNISASSIVSKYRGDSEKLVRILFELARYHAPSTIFLDEIDSIMAQRGGQTEHEASRRMKTELLVQMDGLAPDNDSSSLVFVLAASNLPWELDQAMLRRLEKRIHVPLPGTVARAAMLKKLLPGIQGPGFEAPGGPELKEPTKEYSEAQGSDGYEKFAQLTEGYSGADLRLLCKEAAMRPLRRLLCQLEPDLMEDSNESELNVPAVDTKKSWADPSEAAVGPVVLEDVEIALARTCPSAVFGHEKYAAWQKQFGSE